jgi:hypothetical protein
LGIALLQATILSTHDDAPPPPPPLLRRRDAACMSPSLCVTFRKSRQLLHAKSDRMRQLLSPRNTPPLPARMPIVTSSLFVEA